MNFIIVIQFLFIQKLRTNRRYNGYINGVSVFVEKMFIFVTGEMNRQYKKNIKIKINL